MEKLQSVKTQTTECWEENPCGAPSSIYDSQYQPDDVFHGHIPYLPPEIWNQIICSLGTPDIIKLLVATQNNKMFRQRKVFLHENLASIV